MSLNAVKAFYFSWELADVNKFAQTRLKIFLGLLSTLEPYQCQASLHCPQRISSCGQKELSNLQCLKQLFLPSPFRDFYFQQLHERWLFRRSGLLEIFHVVKQRHRFILEHLRDEPLSPLCVLEVHVGFLQKQLRPDIFQREKVSGVQLTQPYLDLSFFGTE